ncbi:MAG: hypothetical protein R2708_27240 [Vicinamibacterales bacterium]
MTAPRHLRPSTAADTRHRGPDARESLPGRTYLLVWLGLLALNALIAAALYVVAQALRRGLA